MSKMRVPVLGWMKIFTFAVGYLVLSNCSSLDDQNLPVEAAELIRIEDFQISLERGYISGRLVNNSKHILTSCVFEFELYSLDSNEVARNDPGYRVMNNGSTFLKLDNPQVVKGISALVSSKFLIREPLKTGYSTEFYYELNLDFPPGEYFYINTFQELKGR